MQQFLLYGRQLTIEELELLAMGDACAPEASPPNMDRFKEQVTLKSTI